jgi:hypothetical protein
MNYSCLSYKTNGGKSGNRYQETFFAGESGTQYFIKPIFFIGENKDLVKFDITFRIKNEIRDSSNFNFSIFSESGFSKIDSISFESFNKHVETFNGVNFLFAEKSKNLFNNRFSVKIPVLTIQRLFRSGEFKIIIYTFKGIKKYTPSKQAKKHFNYINNNIFSLYS